MRHDLGPDLDELLPQCRQRPMFHAPRKGQSTKKIAQVVSQGEHLKPDLVVMEITAGEPRPFDRLLSLANSLFGRTSLIVKVNDPFGRPGEVSHNEAYARKQFLPMPLDLGHNTTRLRPTARLVRKALV